MIEAEYEFRDGMMVFPDGVTYNLAEAIVMARDQLTEVDIAAIHLVKLMFGGEITEVVDPHGYREKLTVVDHAVSLPYPFDHSESIEDTPEESCKSLDELANMFNPFKDL
jgi:hypothetical protein